MGIIDSVGDGFQGAGAANEPSGQGMAGKFCGGSSHRPLGSLQHLPGTAADLLGAPAKGFSGIQRTPRTIRRQDRQRTFEKGAKIVETLGQGEGRHMGPGAVSRSNGAPAGRNREIPAGRGRVSACDDAPGVPDGVKTRPEPLDIYAR